MLYILLCVGVGSFVGSLIGEFIVWYFIERR